ncbi:Hypothetical protein SRAE_2000268300 [Strongyloides ratti]|uniref:Uncharacterized protein n=1 Tax=Strongyloides ratti TaxID=34506 RepID=A0A090LE36_STRRB|nr:Hypothetical protein SRAE_2000268300 [Strongyloides ratti]CEF68022.1 Hypothetical protein SRAE_2000268300 [Strongyloides ratti]
MSDKEDLKKYFDEDNQNQPHKLPGPDISNPIWMVTRRQHTEVSPVHVRDADTYEVVSSPYHTRSVTTTERVHVMQTPLNIDIEDINEDLISSLSPTGNTSKTVFSTTSTHLEGPTQIHGGLTLSGAPLHLGVQMQPESRQTTTVITTTTTTYRVVESSEEIPMETDEDIMSPMTIDLQFLRAMASPQSTHVKTDILIPSKSSKNSDFDKSTDSLSPKDQNYVIINKTENSNPVSPSSEKTKLIFEYIPYDSKYPEQATYTGPVTITQKKDDLQTLPIQHHVQIYHPTGQSDISLEMENVHKIGEKRYQKSSIFKNMFKRRKSTGENNTIPEYNENISNNSDIKDLEELALDDEGNLTTNVKIKTETIKKDDPKKNLGSKISQFFKKNQGKEKDLSKEENLEYLIDNKKLDSMLDHTSLPAYSESFTNDNQQKKLEKIEKKIMPANIEKTFSPDYIYEKSNEQHYDIIEKKADLLEEPIEFHVYIYHPGWYNDIKEEKNKGNNKLTTTNLQKYNEKKEFNKNNPENENKFNDSMNNENILNENDYIIVENDEVDIQQIDDFENIYHYPKNDTQTDSKINDNAKEKKPNNIKDKKGKFSKITSLFGTKYVDYPFESEPFSGKLEEIKPSGELSGLELQQYIKNIPYGCYDKLKEKEEQIKNIDRSETKDPKDLILEKGKHLKNDILGMFKKEYGDYPISEPYLGALNDINKQNDLDEEPLNLHVSKYHVGYYTTIEKPKEDNKKLQKEPSDSGDKKGRFAKITSIFSGKSVDYPVDSEPYSGKLEKTKTSSELSGVPLEQNVETIPSGYYEKLVEKDEPLKTVDVNEIKKPGESLKEKGKHLKDDILGMFKKGHSDYPVSEPYTGKIEETKPSSELTGVSLQQHVEAIPSEYYDKLIEKDEPVKTVEVEEITDLQ